MNIYSIYKITNKTNGKHYIGFTSKSIQKRLQDHVNMAKQGSQNYIHRAIRKYGKDNFITELIYQSHELDDTLNNMEPHFIAEYNTFKGVGYNMTIGGEGTIGYKWSDKQRKTLSEYSKQLVLEEKSNAGKIGKDNHMYGRSGDKHHGFGIPRPDDVKQKISDNHHDVSGKSNPNSKIFKFTDPYGKEYIVEGGFKRFCISNNLVYATMFNVVYKGNRQPSFGTSVGWKVTKL